MHIASAPCSFGVFYGTDIWADPIRYLDVSQEIGYDGVDLGPDGFLGTPAEVERRLAERELGLSGAYVTLGELAEPGSATERQRLDRIREIFDRTYARAAGDYPKPVVSVAGGADTASALGPWSEGRYGGRLPASARAAVADRLAAIAAFFAGAGYDTALHPHLATIFETARDIEPFAGVPGLSLCLDTGHIWLADDDPMELLDSSWPVTMVHLKDADRPTWHAAIESPGADRFPWRSRGFCALGRGDMLIAPLVDVLIARGFPGWLVVEQDRPPGSPRDWDDFVAQQAANLTYLRKFGL